MIEQGIYPNLTNEEYHADPAISRSRLMTFRESPFKYNHPAKEEPTKAMIFGNAFHKFVLENESFWNEYIFAFTRDKRTKEGKAAYENYLFNIGNRIEITESDFDVIQKMAMALFNNDYAAELIRNGIYESSYFWRDANTGLMLKCRPDILHSNMIVDLKTIADASTRSYQREMINRGYHIQGAMIREGVYQLTGNDIPNVINICIEKTYPFEIGIKIIGESALEAGKQAFFESLLELNTCIRDNVFPNYSIETVELPSWHMNT